MDTIQRLTKLVKKRAGGKLAGMQVRMMASLMVEVKKQLDEDGLSMTVLLDAVLDGYVNRHPAVISMIDEFARKQEKASTIPLRKKGNVFDKKELDEIYNELDSGMMQEED